MPELEMDRERLAVISWALFLVLVASGMLVAIGLPWGPIMVLVTIIAIIFSFRFPYVTLYICIALTPFLGVMLSIPTGSMIVGLRAFGGSIDISIGEVALMFALLGWGLRLLFLWTRRRDVEWKPRLPLMWPVFGLVAAHLASIFSPYQPDPLLVTKFALRPVLFDYIAFVALPINYIRSRKRLVAALGALCIVCAFAALNGLVAMFFPTDPGAFIGRARPLAMFGVSALGENQNELAELLVVGAPFTLALAWLMREKVHARFWVFLASLQGLIALLTFTRTAWIVLILEVAVLAYGPFRHIVQKHLSALAMLGVIFVPLAVAMLAYTVSPTAESSNSTRLMLTEIAYNLFKTSPIFGAGAGTFLQQVGSTQVFLIEYGDPLDSHGFLQKIAAETGLIGLLALAIFLYALFRLCLKGYEAIKHERLRQTAALLIVGAWGGIAYQFFNTDYWTGKMWLPIGLALAGLTTLATMEKHFVSEGVDARDILPA